MKFLPADKGIKLFDINWKCKSAGPSPNDNERIEIFLLGCLKAAKGNPCPGCFNSITWDSSKAQFSWSPIELADKIVETSSSRYITIGGGEPLDQLSHLTLLVKQLKLYDFHILMYTHYKLDDIKTKDDIKELIKYVDIVIDGEFKQEEKLYKENKNDGFFGSIGSGNQKIWDIKTMKSEYMKNLKSIRLDNDNNLIYIY